MIFKGRLVARVEHDFEFDAESVEEAEELADTIGPGDIVELYDIEIEWQDWD